MNFNEGSVVMAIFMANLTSSDETEAHILYDTDGADYAVNQTEYVQCLLQNGSINNFNVTSLFVVTWNKYKYCDGKEVS